MSRTIAVCLLLLAGCSSSEPAPPERAVEGTSTIESGAACVPPSPLTAPVDPPPPVVLPPGSVLTDVTLQDGQRLVTGRVAAPVAQVLEHFRGDPGYVVTRDEDEGRAGRLQLFGAGGDVAVTVAVLTCPRGQTGFTIVTPTAGVTQPSPPG